MNPFPSGVVPTEEPVPCPVCGVAPEQQERVFCKANVQFRKCPSCHLEMINPRPTAQWLADRYRWLAEDFFLDPRKVRSDFQSARFDVEGTMLSGLTGRLADIGCADGPFVKIALGLGFEAVGIDIMESAIEFGRRAFGLPLECGDFIAGYFDSNTFDVVTLWATLEHLAQPSEFLSEAYRVLRPGGAVIVSVPNMRSLTHRLLGQRDRLVCIEHLNYFTATNLSRSLIAHRFVVDLVKTRKINPRTIVNDFRGHGRVERMPDEMVTDQMSTDRIKTGALFAPMRVAHGAVERTLGFLGLGDLLMVRGRKV